MTSLEIAGLTGKRHDHVMRDTRKMFIELGGVDCPQTWGEYKDSTGRTLPVINLDKEQSLCLVAGYSAKLRMNIIKRWQELENNQHKLPQTFGEALQLAANQAVQIEDQQKQLTQQAPAVEFVDNYTKADTGSKGFRETAKLLSIKENVFRKFLVDSKIMYRLGGTWVAYQTHIDCGRFEMITGESNGHIHNLTKFTAKGITWIAGEYAKSKVGESK
jgi:phage antirepressor YoqD-like protein